jgi:pyruvate kinase
MVSTDQTIADIRYILKKNGYVKDGDFLVNVASMPIAEQGTTNMLKISRI